MKKYTPIYRLNEQVGPELSSDVLNMTVGELLNNLQGNEAHYGDLEGILLAVQDDISGTSYDGDNELDIEGTVEAPEEKEEIDFTEEEEDEFPTFNDVESKMEDGDQQGGLGEFEF